MGTCIELNIEELVKNFSELKKLLEDEAQK